MKKGRILTLILLIQWMAVLLLCLWCPLPVPSSPLSLIINSNIPQ